MSCPLDFQSRAVGVGAADQTQSHRPECQASQMEMGALGPLILRCQWFCGTFYLLTSDEVAPRYHIDGKWVKVGRTVFPFYHQHGLWEIWENMSWLSIIHHTHTALQENRLNGKDERKWAVCVGALRSHRTLLVVGNR